MAEYLKAEADALKALEDSLAEIPGEYEALLEELTEEDKETFNKNQQEFSHLYRWWDELLSLA